MKKARNTYFAPFWSSLTGKGASDKLLQNMLPYFLWPTAVALKENLFPNEQKNVL